MKKIAVVYGSFHHDYVMQMLDAVHKRALEKKLHIEQEVAVPGSMEKPLAVKRLLLEDNVDAIVVLGIIERGETKHGLVMAQAVITSLINLQLEFLKPVGVAILGPEILPEQIPSRLIPYACKAVDAVWEMLH